MNPSLERNAAIEGLDTVSDLIRKSKVVDEIYAERAAETSAKTKNLQELAEQFKAKRLNLYSQILEFEAQLVCYFSVNMVEQTLRDLIKCDSWGEIVENIQKMARLSDEDRQIIDANTMNAGFEKLDKDMESALVRLDKISKSIEDEFLEKRLRREGKVFRTSNFINILNYITDQERRDILSWLSPLDFRTTQSDTLSRRQEGTGEWLFEDPPFGRWLSGTERTLWCSGIRTLSFVFHLELQLINS